MSIETMTKLATVTVGAGGSATIDFTNIPQTYTDLVIKYSTRCTANAVQNMALTINSSTSNFTWRSLYGGNSSSYGSSSGSTNLVGIAEGNDYTASTFDSGEIYISNYSSSNYKTISADSTTETNGTTSYLEMFATLWSNSAAITSLSLSSTSGNFSNYSTATLYGIKNAAKTAGNSIKATGGNISFDGTYVYHVFPSTGTFTPSTSLVCDYLVVAGGGGGGAEIGGGGGAGGLRSTVGTTGGGGALESAVSLTLGAVYTITVGAGGTGNYTPSNARGSTGSDSSIAGTGLTTITSKGGGGGGANSTNDSGLTGGSGGGSASSASGGTGTSGQGYDGGRITSGAGSAGGGGAGAVGVTTTGDTGSAGGAGVSISAFATATGTGVSGYYAGGGGGAGYLASGGAGGSGGGAAGGSYNTSSGGNGTVNTGGGAGGNASISPAGTGGSGIVIIRYKA